MNDRNEIRALVRGTYDMQKLRIQIGLRIVGNFKRKLGQEPGERETQLDAEGKKILAQLRKEYRTLSEALAQGNGKRGDIPFVDDGLIDNETELALVAGFMQIEQAETDNFKRLGKLIEQMPIWQAFMGDIKGIGPAMAGVIISEFDIHKARYPSSLYRYAGLDCVDTPYRYKDAEGNEHVEPDKREGRGRRQEHLVEATYTDKDGQPKTKRGISFNPFLKTKLVGVLASSFIRAGSDCEYERIYRDYKHRLEHHKEHKHKRKGHRDQMAKRYMIKRFLADLYVAWRTLEGLPVHGEYAEEKLGIVHKKEAV